MVQYVQARFDASFAALSDATRRGVLEQLGRAEEAGWIERYHQLWDARFDELDKVVEGLKRKEKGGGRKTRSEPTPMKNRTTVERKSDRELVVTRTFNHAGSSQPCGWAASR